MQPGGKPYGAFFDLLPLRAPCWELLVDVEARRGCAPPDLLDYAVMEVSSDNRDSTTRPARGGPVRQRRGSKAPLALLPTLRVRFARRCGCSGTGRKWASGAWTTSGGRTTLPARRWTRPRAGCGTGAWPATRATGGGGCTRGRVQKMKSPSPDGGAFCLSLFPSSNRLVHRVGWGRCNLPPHETNAVWVPSGEDYGGVNDRYILASRRVAETLVRDMWTTFLQRERRRNLLLWGRAYGFALKEGSMERLVLLFLRRLGLCVLRFTNVATVVRPGQPPQKLQSWQRLERRGHGASEIHSSKRVSTAQRSLTHGFLPVQTSGLQKGTGTPLVRKQCLAWMAGQV